MNVETEDRWKEAIWIIIGYLIHSNLCFKKLALVKLKYHALNLKITRYAHNNDWNRFKCRPQYYSGLNIIQVENHNK